MKRLISYVITAVLFLFLTVCSIEAPADELSSGESLVIQRYRKAMELDPDNVNIRYQFSVALLKENRYKEALVHLLVLKDALDSKPEIHYYLGITYAGTGSLDMAMAEYVRVEVIDLKRARVLYELDKVYYNLGIAYQRREDTDSAIVAYDKSIAIDRGQALAYCRRGELYFEKRKYERALEDLYICDGGLPGEDRTRRYIISTRLAKGLALVSEERYEEAFVDFEKIVELDPENENAIYFQGYIRYQKGDYVQAQRILGELRLVESWEIRENLPPLLQNIAVELQKREDWASAEKALVQAIDYKKNNPDLQYLMGYNYKNKGEYRLAVEHIKEALRLSPGHHKAILALAFVTERLIEQHARRGEDAMLEGDYSAAVKHFDSLLEIDPANQRALERRRRAAQSLATRSIEASKKRGMEIEERLEEANEHLARERYRDALVAFRHLLAIDPGNPDAVQGAAIAGNFADENKERRALMGDSYMEREDFYLALKEYGLASGYDPDDTLIQAKVATARERLSSIVRPLVQEGAALEEAGRFAEAISAYDSALKINPESRSALRAKTGAVTAFNDTFRKLFNKGREQLTAADYPGAMDNFRQAERLKPGDTRLKKEMAKAMAGLGEHIELKMAGAESAMKKGDYPTAIAAYTEVKGLDAGNREAEEGLTAARGLLLEIVTEKVSLASDAFSRVRYQSAYDIYGEVLALDKGNMSARDGRARARRKLEAVASFINKGIARYDKKDDKGAAYDFRKVLEIDPSNRTAKKYLANISRRKGPKLSKKEVERLYLEGIELYTDGQYVGAIKKWEKVLKGDSSHSKALFNIKKAKRKLEGVMDVK